MIHWYNDHFFYYGGALSITGKSATNWFMGKPLSLGMYKWVGSVLFFGTALHLMNVHRLNNMQRKLEREETIIALSKFLPHGNKEGRQLDDYEEEIKRLSKRINY